MPVPRSFGLELGWIYGYYGSLSKAFELTEEALTITEVKQPGFRNLPLAILVRLHLLNRDIKNAHRIAGAAFLQPISIPLPRYVIVVELANVELALANNEYEQALELADGLLAEVSPLTQVDIPMVLQRKAEALIGLNRLDKAHQTLTQACSLVEEMGSKHHLWSVYLDLADVNTRLEQPEQVDAYREKARIIVEGIAIGLEEIGLSQSFLKQPRVQAIMRQQVAFTRYAGHTSTGSV